MKSAIFKDARYFQILFQLIFLSYGIYFLHWSAENWLYATYLFSAITTQLLCELILKRKNLWASPATFWQGFKKGIPSVIITSFGLILLLKTNDFYVAAFASAVAIISKYTTRFRGKHIFNPSALGIVAAIFLTGKAWVSPGQWGSGAVMLFAAVCLGCIIVTRVQKLDVSLAFLGTFASLIFIRQVIFLGWPLDFFVQSLSTGSLLLFSFFMITDPKTTPDHSLARIIWSIAIGTVAFYFSVFKYMNGAPIFALVCLQPLVPVLDYYLKEKGFHWLHPPPQSTSIHAGLQYNHQPLHQ